MDPGGNSKCKAWEVGTCLICSPEAISQGLPWSVAVLGMSLCSPPRETESLEFSLPPLVPLPPQGPDPGIGARQSRDPHAGCCV